MNRITASVFLILICQLGLSMQECAECACCKGSHTCDSNKSCITGCIDGYYGDKCTDECLENCKTCMNGFECTECKPGSYTNKCKLPCGKGCINNSCHIFSGECQCKSTDFVKGKCSYCLDFKYGDDCNYTCPTNCGTCKSDTQCSWCINSMHYGSHCQYICSSGCDGGKCNKGTGNCMKGCKTGYTGDKCEICPPGFYGRFCDLNCTENCSACLSKDNCTECKPGYFGESCEKTCPAGCDGNCTISDGACFECKTGLYGKFCNNTCKNRTDGVNCSKSCRDVVEHCKVCSTDKTGSFKDCTECDSGYYLVIPIGESRSKCLACPNNCKYKVCNITGQCTNGCLSGKWNYSCNNDCKTNCVECTQSDGKCSECSHNTFSDDCSKNCSTNCSNANDGRICANDTGKCLQGCTLLINHGKYCEKQCSSTCKNQSCDWRTGHCLGCDANHYGPFCKDVCPDTCFSRDDESICNNVNGHCLYGCKNGLHGERCDKNCSSQCANVTCHRLSAECLHGCKDGYEGPKCVKPIKDPESEANNVMMIIASSAGGGIAVIIVLVILVICLIRRKRRQKLSSNKSCEENDFVQDMQEIRKQTGEDEQVVINNTFSKSNQEAESDANEDYDIAHENDNEITDTDNDYCTVNTDETTKKKSKNFKICDAANINKNGQPLINDNEYAVVKKEKSAIKKSEINEEVYDTTHDNKNNRSLNSNNEYAVLRGISKNTRGVGKSNKPLSDDEHYVYDTTGEKKIKTLLNQSNDYDVFERTDGDKHKNDMANTLYDTTRAENRMKHVNNDYEF